MSHDRLQLRTSAFALRLGAALVLAGCEGGERDTRSADDTTTAAASMPSRADRTESSLGADAALDPYEDPRDGQVYPRIAVAGSVWLGKNLAWEAPTGSFCYENNPANCKTGGRLYAFDVATTACPTGYHLSTDDEWMALESALGVPAADLHKDGQALVRGTNEGTKLKGGGSSRLAFPMTGYAMLSHGHVVRWDGLTTGTVRTYIWTSTRGGAGVFRRRLDAENAHVFRFSNVADAFAIVVRCVEDVHANP